MKGDRNPKTLEHQRTPPVIAIDIEISLSLRGFLSFRFSRNSLYLCWLFCDWLYSLHYFGAWINSLRNYPKHPSTASPTTSFSTSRATPLSKCPTTSISMPPSNSLTSTLLFLLSRVFYWPPSSFTWYSTSVWDMPCLHSLSLCHILLQLGNLITWPTLLIQLLFLGSSWPFLLAFFGLPIFFLGFDGTILLSANQATV